MMRKNTLFLLGASAAAMLTLGSLAGLAQAGMKGGMGAEMRGGRCAMLRHGPGMMGLQLMERYDANKDGKVTQAEIDQNRQQWLAEFDADKDGALSLEEFKQLWLKSRNEMMVREFQFFDRDGNGQVTIAEYQGPMADLVAARDRNDDGSLGADDRPGEGRGQRHGQMMGRGHGMLVGGPGPCMGDGGGPEDPPGEEPASP